MKKITKNDIVQLQITGMTSEGAGVGRYDGMAIFVPNTAEGDEINCRIVKTLKSYCFGIVEKIITPSKDRIEPDCEYFSKCGGCVYRHINYEAELKIKHEKVRSAIERVAGFKNVPVNPIIAADNRCNYRNKAQIPLGKDKDGNLIMGYFGKHSHRIVNMTDCMLQPREFTKIMEVFRSWHSESLETIYDEISHTGVLRHLYLRYGETSGEIMVCIVINGKTLKTADKLVEMLRALVPKITSVVININTEKTNVILGKTCHIIYGSDTISDTLCGLNFDISPLSFYQVNRTQAEKLYEKAAEYANLTENERLIDIYCGTGTIGLAIINYAKNAKRLIGVEIIKEAVEDAKANAKKNNLNAEFICEDAGSAAKLLIDRGEKPDVVVLDPPRKGCSPELILAVADMAPDRVVYVSCDPATLGRDLKIFSEYGYIPREITPCDLFPGTSHIECVAVLHRVEKQEA